MDKQLSKTLSYFLRHAPENANLSMDEQGFVSLDELVEALRERSWPTLTIERMIELLDDPEVERFERQGEAVRARYGHSVEVDLDYAPTQPPEVVYHGTTPNNWRKIRRKGLKPMSRQHVHLSRTREEALRVARRHTDHPVVLEIRVPPDTDRAFYRAGPVILTDFIPVDWIQRVDD